MVEYVMKQEKLEKKTEGKKHVEALFSINID